MVRVLFVCLGNICRSPSAENIFRHLVKTKGLDSVVECDSCGTGAWHTGEPPHPKALAMAQKRNIPMTGKARALRDQDIEVFDYIIPMDRSNLRDVKDLVSRHNRKPRVELLLKFAKNKKLAEECNWEVPDPFYGFLSGGVYGGDEEFEFVFDLLEDACEGLLEAIISNRSTSPTSSEAN
ncbi:Low molecular weight protein-tyrosine-phosphatase YfkJ [Galdieria sulphuraria]|uniref:Protein-tyrosine phosphatase n=1 Tax=Galdieria sulphuraria TaxID=130081 RepID=M2Y4T8_GALSU|nr:protein-tyrosine phosphatase [Galdieria sulphuraria]EME30983.1 protein-tyrosine phosphatase [Galdieria sulphuraria]GJD10946.1 Low molecular weight protein-tyrosine-phosphatase YfkJ [Galdieria sulphuraria]|eukprot:XP_005707503.1 protein-tyrosine phosphatase [Galdieria sulphuraria]